MATIAILGTFDTKGAEHGFVADWIRAHGHHVLLIDVGTGDEPTISPDITRHEVAAEAGIDLAPLLAAKDRGACVTAMCEAAPRLVARLAAERRIDGILSLGGGGGTAIGTAAMRALPIGFPKWMVSTLAAGQTAHYLGTKDIVMMPSLTDVAGLNRLSRLIFTRAAAGLCGMVEARIAATDERPLIVASMFGNTTACLNEAKRVLEEAGYEVLVFAATGTGGRTMESLIESGLVTGVLDLTTTEWADELLGGVLSAGPHRLEAAARAGLPTVLAPGCLDMVNFGEPSTVPDRYRSRRTYAHNPQVTLLRTEPDECKQLGRIIAEKVNDSVGPAVWMLPARGLSALGEEGQPFHHPAADAALLAAIRESSTVPVREFDLPINSPDFARACAEQLLGLLETTGKRPILP